MFQKQRHAERKKVASPGESLRQLGIYASRKDRHAFDGAVHRIVEIASEGLQGHVRGVGGQLPVEEIVNVGLGKLTNRLKIGLPHLALRLDAVEMLLDKLDLPRFEFGAHTKHELVAPLMAGQFVARYSGVMGRIILERDVVQATLRQRPRRRSGVDQQTAVTEEYGGLRVADRLEQEQGGYLSVVR